MNPPPPAHRGQAVNLRADAANNNPQDLNVDELRNDLRDALQAVEREKKKKVSEPKMKLSWSKNCPVLKRHQSKLANG